LLEFRGSTVFEEEGRGIAEVITGTRKSLAVPGARPDSHGPRSPPEKVKRSIASRTRKDTNPASQES